MTQQKNYIVTFVSTAVFAVLSLILMIVFKTNEEYFDTHGRLGTLAQTEQQSIILETTKASSYKRNIKVTVDDRHEGRLILPLTSDVPEENISIREEFANGKIVLNLKDVADFVENDTAIVTDSWLMDAVGLYKQDDDVILEIYESMPLGIKLSCTNSQLIIDFDQLNNMYDYIAVIYIPFEKKDRLYSEEWISQLSGIAGENKKIYFASAMREVYTAEQVLNFANSIQADTLIEIDYEDTNDPEHIDITYNADYFIPDFSSADLAILERKVLEEKTGMNVGAFIEAGEDDILVKEARLAAAKASFYIETDRESIEERYTLNHNVMEAITSMIKEILERQEVLEDGV